MRQIGDNRTMAELETSTLNLLGSERRSVPSGGTSVMRERLDRYFEFSLFLLVAAGFLTIASSGALDFPSVLVVSMALLVRGWFLLRGRAVAMPESWDAWVSVGYVAFYLFDFLFLSGRFVNATVHLVLLSMVAKLFSTRRDRDYVYLALLAFLEVLAACVLTVDTGFLVAFVFFLVLAAVTFTAFEIKRSWAASEGKHLPAAGATAGAARLIRSLGLTSAILMTGMVVVGSALFFLLPRVTAGYLARLTPRNRLESGFSEEVRLGQIGEIQQSSAVVMHIQVEGDRTGAHDLYWRGLSLGLFDGRTWFSPLQRRAAPVVVPGRFDLRAIQAAWQAGTGEASPRHPGERLRYRVLMEPIGTNVFFLANNPAVLNGDYRMISVDAAGSVFNADGDRPIGTYEAESEIGAPSADELRKTANIYPAGLSLRYLQQVPRLDPRVRKLAEEITRQADTPYDKAKAIEQYLRTHFGYTLQLSRTVPADPLAEFLFERKQGHCEYFASAMAIMLRTVGVPSRVVNGFRGGEFNDVTGSYIIRARDAHSWVEAYFPGYGWATFDPTPASAMTPAYSRMGLYLDAMREFWREWIVNYDFSHQRNLSLSALVRSMDGLERARRRFRDWDVSLILSAYTARENIAKSPRLWGGIVMGGGCFVVLLLNLRRLKSSYRRYRLTRNPQRAPEAAASLWYLRMTDAVARRGWRKHASQTPQEFVAVIGDEQLRGSVADFTDHYCRARFGASVEDVQRLGELFERIQRRR